MRIGIAAAGLSCMFAGYVLAQQLIDQPREQAVERQAIDADQPAGQADRAESREYTAQFRGSQAAGTQNQEVQKFLVGCLLSKNKAEVEIAEFAQQQAQNPEVKGFAQTMVRDHQKLVQELQQMAGAHGAGAAERARTTTSPNAIRQPDAGTATATTTRAVGNSAVDQLLAIENQITERCKQALRDELQQKQGIEFDKCFVNAQIGGHMKSLAALEVIQQQGPEQLQQVAQKAQPIVQQHLEHAKELAKQLDAQSATGSRTARQPSEPQRE
jgi:predicted outer membrane protein